MLALLQFNHLQPPFNNAGIRRAFLSVVQQSDYMTATMGEDRSLWQDNVGYFLPGSPAASDEGLGVLKQPRSIERAKKELQAAGYNGEKIVFLVPPPYFPSPFQTVWSAVRCGRCASTLSASQKRESGD